jgi:hypothetical protein
MFQLLISFKKNIVARDPVGAAGGADADTATATDDVESEFHDVQIEYKGAMNRPGFIGKTLFLMLYQ